MSTMTTRGPYTNAEERFIERMGLAGQDGHLTRIAGRILGLLLLEEEALGFEEIASRLQVSRGSVSTNTRLLLSKGIIERVTRPGDRRDYFQIGREPGRGMLERAIQNMTTTRDLIAEMRRSLDAPSDVIARRLAGMETFYATTMRHIEEALDELGAEAS